MNSLTFYGAFEFNRMKTRRSDIRREGRDNGCVNVRCSPLVTGCCLDLEQPVGPTTLCLSCKPASHGGQQSGTPVAATRECARKRRAAVQGALRQAARPPGQATPA
jgi:hypothetical protein